MSTWCTNLHFFMGTDAWMVREWLSKLRSASFLVLVPLPASTHWDRWAPQRERRAWTQVGGGGGCLHMVWVLLVFLYSLRHLTHDLVGHCEDAHWQPGLQSQKVQHTQTPHLNVSVWLRETDQEQRWLPRHCLTQWDAHSLKPTNRKLLFKSLKKWRLSHT